MVGICGATAKFPLGSKGHLETPLRFVSWILSRVVRGQHRPGKEHHEDRKEKSHGRLSPMILARAYTCICPWVGQVG